MNNHSRRRGLLAAALAAVTAAALSLTGGLAAQAADIPDTSDVVITKLSTPPAGAGDAATGIQAGQTGGATIPTGAAGIAEVTFTYYPIPVTGTAGTNEWQQNLAAVTLAQAQAAVTAGPIAGTALTATDADGITTWKDAPQGLYLVRETSAPPGVTPAADFLVAIPLTDPADRSDWLDTIYIYPKNSKVTATKTVDEGASVAVGQNVTWTILGDIPRDDRITKYELSDTLDLRLTYVPTAAVSLTGASGVTLAAGDYTLTPSGQVLTLAFTQTGLDKLETAWKADATAQVKLDVVTTVNSTALNPADTSVASIENIPVLTVNDAQPVTGIPATLKVGDIKIVKKDAQSGAALAAGKVAVFSVYLTKADASARTNPISINGVTEFTTTNGTGQLTISGLFFSDFVDGVTVTDAASYRGYWVAEVEAPEGYQLLAAPVNIPVTAAGTDVRAVDILNVPNTGGFVLPLTGGTGTLFLTLSGLALLAVVLLLVVRRRARQSAE